MKRAEWNNDYFIPPYNREVIKVNTKKAPIWLHFGAGNIFRAFIAADMDKLLEQGLCDKGIIVCEDFDKELIEKVYEPFDSLSLLVTLKANGEIEKRVIGSVVGAVTEIDEFKELFRMPSVQIVSFTITEKGYTGPLMRRIAELCMERYQSGAYPVALVIEDKFPNGRPKLEAAGILFSDRDTVDRTEKMKVGTCLNPLHTALAVSRSDDPRLSELSVFLSGIELGNKLANRKELKQLLGDQSIFGIDLNQYGLADKVIGMFQEMIAGKGAVRRTLCRYCD